MSAMLILLSVVTLATYVSSTSLTKDANNDSPTYRLPETLVPTFYNLSLTIYPDQDSYVGTVIITFDVTDPETTINDIYLHLDPEFIVPQSVILNENTGTSCSIDTSNEAHITGVTCPSGATGEGNTLYIDYAAKFSTDDGYGMVKSRYVDGGKEEILIESYFKPTFARRAFPCLDEPDLKANFSVMVSHPRGYTVLSDSPVLADDYDPSTDLQTTTFATTPKISTYLVSIFISSFKATSVGSGDYDFKIFTRADVANLTTTVVGSYYGQIMEKLGEYTGVPYQNLSDSECYQVAIPDYYSDSMGDFGLYTYRETDLLDEGDKTPKRVKQNIITAMAYKLSHEWYGGDISTKWWSDVWANEAVAEYLQYVIADEVSTELDLTNQFVVEVVRNALQYDAMPFAQPLSSRESDVNVTRNIENKLDAVSYQKGASLLHMIKYIVGGEENFKTSLQYHWTQRSHSDTDGSSILKDLALLQYIDDLYSCYKNWAFAPGFPLVTVTVIETTEEKETVSLTRKRFVYPIDNITTYADVVWTIPISTTTSNSQNFDGLINILFKPNIELQFYYKPDNWIVVNLQGRLFYRVNYDLSLWRKLINVLKSEDERTDIHFLNRAQMVDDIFSIARIGEVDYSLAFELADFLVNETDYYPWYSAFAAFSYLLGKLGDEGVENNLKYYILSLMANVVDIPSSSDAPADETHIDTLKKVMILDWACNLGHSGCVSYATDKFDKFKEAQISLDDYNLRRVVLCTGLKYSNTVVDDWKFLWDVYNSTSSVHEQSDILNALGCAENKNVLEAYLHKTITKNSGIKRQDALVVFKSVLSSSLGLETTMEFLEKNFASIASFYKDVKILSDMLYAVAERLFTDDHIEWLQRLVSDATLDEYEDVRSKAVVLASVNNYWAKNYQDKIGDILPTVTTNTTTARTTPTTTTSTTTVPSTPSSTTSTSTTSQQSTTISTSTTTGSSCRRIVSKFVLFVLLIIAVC